MALTLTTQTNDFKEMFAPQHAVQPLVKQIELIVGTVPGFSKGMYASGLKPPSVQDVEQIFAAYCRYLQRRNWYYQTIGNWTGALEANSDQGEVAKFQNMNLHYSVFMFPNRPTANCCDAALGFLSLLYWLGLTQERVQLIRLNAREQDDTIVMRGLQKAVRRCLCYVSYVHQIPSAGYEIRLQGDRLIAVPITQMVIDMPFDNHYFVKFGNVYWDPTYGFSFTNPNAVFCSCKNWDVGHPGFGGVPSAGDGIFHAKSLGYWVAQLNTPGRQKYLTTAVPGLKVEPGQYFCFFKDTTRKESLKVVGGRLALVPPALARSVFTVDGFLKPRLMKAVHAYENSSNFLRSPSLETKTALAQIRRYAGDYSITDANVQKKYYRQKDVKVGKHIWTDEEAFRFAREAIKPGNALVGTRLQQNLAKEFEKYKFCFEVDVVNAH